MAVLGSSVAACRASAGDRGREKEVSGKTIEQVLKERTPDLMSLPGVVGTAQSLCEGRPCIKVFVVKETPGLRQEIHNILEGYPVVIEETGRILPRPEKQD